METITRTSITRRKLGPWAELLLTKNGYLKKLHKTKKGEVQSFEILKPLPETAALNTIRTANFTTTVESLVSDAFSTFEDLISDLSDWYDNLPEQFQNGDKGQEINDAKDAFEGLEAPEIPEAAGKLTTVYVPYEWIESKEQRKSDAISRLEAAIEVLTQAKDAQGESKEVDPKHSEDDNEVDFDEIMDALKEAKDEAEGIEIPAAFS